MGLVQASVKLKKRKKERKNRCYRFIDRIFKHDHRYRGGSLEKRERNDICNRTKYSSHCESNRNFLASTILMLIRDYSTIRCDARALYLDDASVRATRPIIFVAFRIQISMRSG